MVSNLYLNAGQMKAGTTFLYQMLEQHKDIYFSLEKEVHYLSQVYGKYKLLSDSVRLRKAKQLLRLVLDKNQNIESLQNDIEWVTRYLDQPVNDDWYQNIFKGVDANKYAADFSNLTCTIPASGLKDIKNKFDNVKVTYCLRTPVLRAFSHMKFHLKFAGKNIKIEQLTDPELTGFLLSDDIYPQGETLSHVEKLVSVFGEDSVRLIQCEEMWEHPQKTVDNICYFLGINGLKINENMQSPTNVGPKELMSERVENVIRNSIIKEIKGTEKCKIKYKHLFI